jgi:hypothetical protein
MINLLAHSLMSKQGKEEYHSGERESEQEE